jgi:hypothetical protein
VTDYTLLHYDHHSYPLHPDTEVPQLKEAVVAACRVGGDLVTFIDDTGGTVAVLVSPGCPLAFETRAVPDATEHPGGAEFDYLGGETHCW